MNRKGGTQRNKRFNLKGDERENEKLHLKLKWNKRV